MSSSAWPIPQKRSAAALGELFAAAIDPEVPGTPGHDLTAAGDRRTDFDLDRRRITRHPGTHDPRHASNRHPLPPVNQLPDDDAWTTLTALIQCRTGRPLIALDERRYGPGYRISTSITHIEQSADDPGVDPPGDPR